MKDNKVPNITSLLADLQKATHELKLAQVNFKKAEERLSLAAVNHDMTLSAFQQETNGIKTANHVDKFF
jgi:hypothetical protein